jgi:hypothetical protein
MANEMQSTLTKQLRTTFCSAANVTDVRLDEVTRKRVISVLSSGSRHRRKKKAAPLTDDEIEKVRAWGETCTNMLEAGAGEQHGVTCGWWVGVRLKAELVGCNLQSPPKMGAPCLVGIKVQSDEGTGNQHAPGGSAPGQQSRLTCTQHHRLASAAISRSFTTGRHPQFRGGRGAHMRDPFGSVAFRTACAAAFRPEYVNARKVLNSQALAAADGKLGLTFSQIVFAHAKVCALLGAGHVAIVLRVCAAASL